VQTQPPDAIDLGRRGSRLLGSPRDERTRKFLRRVTEAGRL
jgi:hypothetical protein